MEKTKLFEEKPGVMSFIRFQSHLVFWFTVLLDGFLVAHYYSSNPLDGWFIALQVVLLTAMFYPKYLQKFIEVGADKLKALREAVKQ